jgi:hypothetical protein
MATDRADANRVMLTQAAETQDKTKEAIKRIQKQAADTESLASLTLEELHKQGLQMVCPAVPKRLLAIILTPNNYAYNNTSFSVLQFLLTG